MALTYTPRLEAVAAMAQPSWLFAKLTCVLSELSDGYVVGVFGAAVTPLRGPRAVPILVNGARPRIPATGLFLAAGLDRRRN